MKAGDLVRAVRRTRRLSQRELAEVTCLPASTVDRIESGHTPNPRLGTVETILNATGYYLVAVNRFGRALSMDDEHDWLRDEAARRFPAHLPIAPVVAEGRDGWWGWRRIAWLPEDPTVPLFTHYRRGKYPPPYLDDYYADERWNDAT